MYSPTKIDLSAVRAPNAIDPLDFETLNSDFLTRFKAYWEVQRGIDPTLPAYDVDVLETDPVVIASQAFAYLRLLDRARVNAAVKAVLAPLAKGADLDNVVARANVQRATIVPATSTTAAVMETDERLLYRYLLAFDRPSAGSADRYAFEALTAVPSLLDVRINGWAVHGRRGDTDVVLAGPGGRLPTADEVAAVYAACTATHVKPEATRVTIVPVKRATYSVVLTVEIPSGPSAAAVKAEVETLVSAAATARMVIGGEVPIEAVAGAAYGNRNALKVSHAAPTADIPPDTYTIPVMTGLSVSVVVR